MAFPRKVVRPGKPPLIGSGLGRGVGVGVGDGELDGEPEGDNGRRPGFSFRDRGSVAHQSPTATRERATRDAPSWPTETLPDSLNPKSQA